MVASRKYWAFISYSHQDEAWAQWLHQALETYRVPRRLVGRALRDEAVPRRLFPIFRDRDELPSSHELGAVLTQALRDSRNLIVICSPRSATSRWVNEEIKAWRALGRSDRIFCLIVDGEPNASATPELAFSECFAPALRGDASFEPIAADARERKDGKSGAKLKLIAGWLGVGLDELKQREKQRQFWQRVQATAAGLAFVGICVGAWQWYLNQRGAREQEIRIEKLVESGRLELLDGRQARAAVYLNEALKLGHDTVPLRFMLSQAMQPIDALTDVRIRHGGGPVRRAVFSPDGKQFVLVVRLSDGAVAKLYDSSTGQQQATFTGVPALPWVIQFLPDGKRMFISGISDSQIDNPQTGIWEVGRETPALLLSGYAGRVGIPLRPDGKVLLSPDERTGLNLIDAGTGRTVSRIASDSAVAAASYSPDSKLVAIADRQGEVSVWLADANKRLGTLPGRKGESYNAIAFSPTGDRVVAASTTGNIRIWDAATRELILAFAPDGSWITQFSFSADGRRLLTIGSEGFKVWSARGVLLFASGEALNPGANAALSADGNLLFTADHLNNSTDVWDVLSRRKLYTTDLHTNAVTAVGLHPAGERLLIASQDGRAELVKVPIKPWWREQSARSNPGNVRFDPAGARLLVAGASGAAGFADLYELAGRKAIRSFDGYPSYFRSADWMPDSPLIAFSSPDGHAVIYDSQTGKMVNRTGPAESAPVGTSFSSDGKRLLVRSDAVFSDARARDAVLLWSLERSAVIADLGHDSGIRAAAINAAGDRIATAAEDSTVKLWNGQTGEYLAEFKGHSGPVYSAVFSARGDELLTASHDNSVRIWNAAGGSVVHVLANAALGNPNLAIFSPDERVIAIGSANGVVWLWDRYDDRLWTLKGHSAGITQLRFLHSGHLLASVGNDATARIWDAASGKELNVIAAHRNAIFSFDVSADEQLAASAGFDGIFAVWNIGLERRLPSEVDKLLRCHAPWSLDQVTLRQKLPEPCG